MNANHYTQIWSSSLTASINTIFVQVIINILIFKFQAFTVIVPFPQWLLPIRKFYGSTIKMHGLVKVFHENEFVICVNVFVFSFDEP